MTEIRLQGIDKRYGTEKVLEGLDLRIEPGSFTVLLGPSGCGKSTLLRLLAGLEKENAGEIFIGGTNMKGVEPGDRGIAMVFQNYALYPAMTVRENMEFGLRNMKVPKVERDRRIAEVVSIVGLGDYMHKKPQFLSGGQRQRVALARAMVRKPDVFLMDEPLSNLDAKLRTQIRADLIELHRRLGVTFVYVTHDQVEAMSMGTDIVLMEKGQIRQQGAPQSIYNDPENAFTARFIGTPPMNVFRPGDLPASEGVALASGMMPDRAVMAGFRPEKADLRDRPYPAGIPGLVLEGVLGTHEMLGSEVLYRVHAAGENLCVKLYENRPFAWGKVWIHVQPEHVYWFDETGARIRDVRAEVSA